MVYGYVRTSTGGQDGSGQRTQILEYAAKEGVKVDRWVKEQSSSRKKRSEREITGLVSKLQEGDTVLVAELSRLARSSTMELSAILQDVREKGATVIVVGDGIEISPDGTDIYAETMVWALGIAARIERDLISSRTTAALQARKAEGVKLGRPVGSSKLKGREDEIQKYLKIGLSKTAIAKLLGVARSTLYDYLETREATK